ncbi:hypothetical protein SAMN04488693_1523, partial [Arthrobacter subterraneus]
MSSTYLSVFVMLVVAAAFIGGLYLLNRATSV